MDDAVYGLASIFDAMFTGDNDRFHLETVHHSDREIQIMLRLGKKIQKVAYMVDDEDQDKKHDSPKNSTMPVSSWATCFTESTRDQQDLQDYDTAYDEEPDENMEEEFDEEFEQYHGFGGMGGMSGMGGM